MSAMGRRPIEEIADEALQSLLAGESAETVMSRYPGYEDDLGPVLAAAGKLKRAPHPQLPQSSLAAMLAHAQALAETERKTLPVILPVLPPSSDVEVVGIERPTGPRRTVAATARQRPTFTARVISWIRLPGALSGMPRALALALVVMLGLFVVSRFVGQPQPPVLPVPTVSSQFSLDGHIEKIASNMWVVGGNVIYLDTATVIQGTPSIGSLAHIEGDIAGNNRRIARSIKVAEAVASTVTPQVDSGPTEQPTAPAISGRATVSPGAAPTVTAVRVDNAKPAATVPPTAASSYSASSATSVTVAPRPTVTVLATSAKPPIMPTNTVPPLLTNTPLPAATPEPLATATQVPQPGSAATPTWEPTVRPSDTPESTPTWEPTGTPVPQPTTTSGPDPTEPPEPEDTETPRPTVEPPNTPTSHPTLTAVPSPTGTQEPEETHTAEPTHGGPPPTTTAIPTWTTQPQPTRTEEPDETHTAEPSEEPRETRTAEPTHYAGQ